MTDRYDRLDHTVTIDQIRLGKWRARIYRSTFNEAGVIVGCAHVADLFGVTETGAKWKADLLIRRVRQRGARWPETHDS